MKACRLRLEPGWLRLESCRLGLLLAHTHTAVARRLRAHAHAHTHTAHAAHASSESGRLRAHKARSTAGAGTRLLLAVPAILALLPVLLHGGCGSLVM